MTEERCPVCQVVVEQKPTGARRVFCSNRCKERARKLRAQGMPIALPVPTCLACGAEIEDSRINAKHCSTRCRWQTLARQQHRRRQERRQRQAEAEVPKLSSAERHHQTLVPGSLQGVLADLPEVEGETERQRQRRERHNRVNSYLRSLNLYGSVPVHLLPGVEAGQEPAQGGAL